MGTNIMTPPIVTNGLVLALDASNIRSYISGSNTWNDLSGNGNNGTLVNGPTFSGANGGNLTFNGTNQYVSTPIQSLSRPCTLSVWVNFNSLTGYQTIFGQDTPTAISRGRFYFQKAGSTTEGLILNVVNFSIVLSNNTIVLANAINPVVTNQWYNYSAVLTTTALSLYENGILQNTVNDSNTFLTPNTTITLNAGYFSDAIVDFVNGKSSSFLVYNRALSATEIQQNYNAQKSRFNII
jgi:hypothetical protein